jgi:hypothetical protein
MRGSLESYLLLVKGAKGGACVQLIQDVLTAPDVFVFGELLESPNVMEVITIKHCVVLWSEAVAVLVNRAITRMFTFGYS